MEGASAAARTSGRTVVLVSEGFSFLLYGHVLDKGAA